MTGIEKIVAKISEDAEAEYRRIVDDAKAQADGILADAKAAARAPQRTPCAAEGERAEIERRAVSMAGLDVRKMRLELKQKLLQRAFDQALAKIISLPDPTTRTFYRTGIQRRHGRRGVGIFRKRPRKFGKAVVRRVNDALKSRGMAVSLSARHGISPAA